MDAGIHNLIIYANTTDVCDDNSKQRRLWENKWFPGECISLSTQTTSKETVSATSSSD